MSAAATALVGLDVGDPTHEAKLNALTVAELRTVCTHFGLVSTGVKATLVDSAASSARCTACNAGGAGSNERRRPADGMCARGHQRRWSYG